MWREVCAEAGLADQRFQVGINVVERCPMAPAGASTSATAASSTPLGLRKVIYKTRYTVGMSNHLLHHLENAGLTPERSWLE